MTAEVTDQGPDSTGTVENENVAQGQPGTSTGKEFNSSSYCT